MPRARLPRGTCLSCGLPLERRASRYCNFACEQAYGHRSYLERWLNGTEAGMGTWANFSKHIRQFLLEQYGGCVICGWAERNPTTGRIPLHIDHIDGDWRNNRPENLRLLCPNHHALTATYGALDRGKGRSYYTVKRPNA